MRRVNFSSGLVMLFLLGTASLLFYHLLQLGRTQAQPTRSSTTSERGIPPRPHSAMREIFAPIFLANKEFASKMLVYNVRNDETITFAPALLIEGHEIALSPSTIAPHGTAAVDISAELAARRISAEFGAVVIRYDFQTTGAINAIVTSASYCQKLCMAG